MRRYRLAAPTSVLLTLCAMSFIMYVDRTNISTAAVTIQAEFHLSNSELGLVFSAFALTYALAMIPTSFIADRIGAYRMLTFAGLLWAGGTVLTGFATGFTSLILARFVVGLGESPIVPASSRALTTWMPADRRGFAQGITHACARLGNAAAPLIVATLITMSSWRYAFIALGLCSLVWVVGWWLSYYERPADHPGITAAELARLPPPSVRVQAPLRWRPFLGRLWPATLASFCHGWVLWFFLNWMPLYFASNYGLNLRNSALFTSGVFLSGVVGTTLGGSLSDTMLRRNGNIRSARRNVIVFGFLAPVLVLVPLLGHPGVNLAALCLASALFLSELVTAPLWAVAMDLAPRHAATSSGVMNTGLALAASVSPPVVGWLVDVTGDWRSAIGISMAMLLLGPLAAIFIRPDLPYLGEEIAPPGDAAPRIKLTTTSAGR